MLPNSVSSTIADKLNLILYTSHCISKTKENYLMVQKTRMMIHCKQCGSLYHYVYDMQKDMNGVDAYCVR